MNPEPQPKKELTAEQLKRRLEREKKARAQAEKLLEEKSTELFHLNQKLHQDVRLLETAVINAHDGVIITDVDIDHHGSKVVYANDAFLAITGYSEKEILAHSTNILYGEETDQETLHRINEALRAGKPFDCELISYKKDGASYWMHISIAPVFDDRHNITNYTAITRDITAQKDYEDTLKLERARAEAANIAKSDFLATMSHELRTPMNGIIGMTELLLESDLNLKQTKHAHTVIRSAESLLGIINDVLDFSKIESGKLEIEPIPFDMRTLSENITELLSAKSQEKGIELIQNYVTDTPRFLIGDSVRIGQIIQNLIGNAIKFTDKGHVSLRVEELKDTEKPSNHTTLKISVTDTGIGIPEEAQTKIFEKFSQADASTTRKFGGTGLGLNITQQLAEKMNGDIGVESVEGKGSTFWVTLTLENNNNIESQTKLQEQNHDLSKLKGTKILIVDDIDLNLELLEERLTCLGVEIFSCINPLDACGILMREAQTDHPIDIAILDYLMPEMDGCVLATTIKNIQEISDTVLVLLSSAGEKEHADKFQSAGFSGLLHKPFRAGDLERALIHVWQTYQDGQTTGIIDTDSLPMVKKHIDSALIDIPNDQEEKKDTDTSDTFRILVVEDNETNQMVIEGILSQMGYDVDIAENGKEGVNKVEQNHYDLIFMDMQMPVMDGLEATRLLRQMEYKDAYHVPPIVALTANAMKGDKERCFDAGMSDYISKPIRKDDIKSCIDQWQTIALAKQ